MEMQTSGTQTEKNRDHLVTFFSYPHLLALDSGHRTLQRVKPGDAKQLENTSHVRGRPFFGFAWLNIEFIYHLVTCTCFNDFCSESGVVYSNFGSLGKNKVEVKIQYTLEYQDGT